MVWLTNHITGVVWLWLGPAEEDPPGQGLNILLLLLRARGVGVGALRDVLTLLLQNIYRYLTKGFILQIYIKGLGGGGAYPIWIHAKTMDPDPGSDPVFYIFILI